MHWGVDSYGPADRTVTVPAAVRLATEAAHTEVTVFELVRRRMGRAPEFWGRYLNRRLPEDRTTHAPESPPNSHRVTPREVDFLHAHACRVLLVYNGSAGRTARLAGGEVAGHDAAAAACRLCDQLEVPAHVVIYADVENWPGNAGWFRGWFDTMRAAGRRCGVYGRPVQVVENPADGSRHYGTELPRIASAWIRREATRRIAMAERWSGATPRRVVARDFWGDELRAALADAVVDGIVERGVDPFRGPGGDPFYVWSNEPRRVLSARSDVDLDGDDIPGEFVPAEPSHAPSTRTVVWQYLENAVHTGGAHGHVDMNLATPAGFAAMW